MADVPAEALNAAPLVCLGSFSFPLLRPAPVELNSVSDSSRRHSPTKRIASTNAGRGGGVTWACAGWSEAVELKERGMGQDDTQTLSPLQRITEVLGDFFFSSKAKVGRTVNETEDKQSHN